MSTRKIGLYAVLVATILMAGCGRAASPMDANRTYVHEEEIPMLPAGLATVVPADKVRALPSPVVGVVVDGRFYPKGEEPTVSATPAPEAPRAGKGHLHASVSLANRTSSFIEKLVVSVTIKGQTSPVFSRTFAKKDLVGTKLSTTATNLAPGEYEVAVTVMGRTGVYSQAAETIKVEDGKTAESKI